VTGNGVANFKVLLKYLPGGNREKKGKYAMGIQSPGQNLNHKFPNARQLLYPVGPSWS
jgi:hypothetical protein